MKNQVIACALTGVLALGAMGCGQQQAQTEQKTEEKTEQADQTATDIAWTDAKSASAAAKGAGLDEFAVPKSVTVGEVEFSEPEFSYANGVAQAVYKKDSATLTVRKAGAKHEAPLTDMDKTDFTNKWMKQYEGLDVLLYGSTKGSATVMTWSSGLLDFGVTFTGSSEKDAIDSTDAAAIVKDVMAQNGSTATDDESEEASSASSSSTSASSKESSSTSSKESDTGSASSDGYITETVAKENATSLVDEGQTATNVSAELVEGADAPHYVVTYNVASGEDDMYYEVEVDAVTGTVWAANVYVNGELMN